MSALKFLTDGPADARDHLVLAHGAGAPMDHPAMEAIAAGVAAAGIRVVRFEFPYMRQRRTGGGRRPPDRQAVLLQTWHAVIDALGGAERLVIGGRSMGGPDGQPHRRRGGRPGSRMPRLPVPSAGKAREAPHRAPGRPAHADADSAGRARRLWIPSRGRNLRPLGRDPHPLARRWRPLVRPRARRPAARRPSISRRHPRSPRSSSRRWTTQRPG